MSLLTEPPPRRNYRPWIFAALAVALAAGASFGVYRLFFKPYSPLDSPEGRVFGRKVSQYLIETQDNLRLGGDPGDQKKRAAVVLDHEDRQALGPEVRDKLETVLRTTVDMESAGRPSKELSDRYIQEGGSLNQTLEDRGLPYYIDAGIISSRRSTFPILYSYYVEREDTLSGSGKTVRSLFVRRLDDLNFAKAALGYTKPSSTAALVVIDHVESQLIDYVLPAAGGAEEPLLVDLESIEKESDWQSDLRARSASIVKSAYADLSGEGPAAVEELGKLFNRRRMLVRAWMKALDKQRYELHIPRRLIPEADYAEDLMGHVPITELREWSSIHDELQERAKLRAFDAIVERQARSVEQHEAQHQLDFARAKVIVPKAVKDLLGAGDAEENYDEFTIYVSNEVSAYLAEVVRGPDAPALTLMILSQSAFDRSEWGGAYCYAALAVLSGVGGALGVPAEELVGHRRVDRAALTKLLASIADKPDAEIRAAARKTWESWYEATLPDVAIEKSTIHPAWRH